MNRIVFACIILFALSLASRALAAVTLYSGEMELVSVSGGGCTEKDKIGSRLRVDLALEQGGSPGARGAAGFFNGPDLERGRFSGEDPGRLQVVYPDKPNAPQGDFLALVAVPGGLDGELREKPQADSAGCYFEKARLKLKQVAAGSKAEKEYLRQGNLFRAEVLYISGHSLLQAGKPDAAILDLTKSLNLRDEVNPGDPDRASSAVPIAVAHLMAGREPKALAVLHDLLGDKAQSGDAMVKLRTAAGDSLCNEEHYLEGEGGRTASLKLMDLMARDFGGLKGVATPLAACYVEIARERAEQDDSDSALEFFQKAVKLNPDTTDGITGVVMSFVDLESPAEGRRFLQGHAAPFAQGAGKASYANLLSYVYAAEAQQEENNGNYGRAEELSREAIKARPGDRALVIALTRILGKEGKIAEAKNILESGSKGCRDAACRREYSDEMARQEMIERMVKRLETRSGIR